MKPAKCRLCGHEHWNSEPRQFKGDAVANSVVANKVRPKADAAGPCRDPARSMQADVASRSTEGRRVQKWREKNRERYNERMRDYMAKRRAKEAR